MSKGNKCQRCNGKGKIELYPSGSRTCEFCGGTGVKRTLSQFKAGSKG